MDIAATVNPATVHFRSLSEPARVSVLEQNYEYDLLEPDKLLRKYVGRDVTLVRTRRTDNATREEEVTARLLSYNNAPVWQIGGEIVTGMRRRSHQVSRAAGQSLLASDADLDARQHRRHAPSRRGVVSRRQAVVERGLRADRRARRQDGRPRWLGDGRERQRHVVQERSAAARRRRSEPRAAGLVELQDDGRDADGHGRGGRAACRRKRSRITTSTRSARKTTVNNSETKQVSMLGATAFPVQKRYVVDGQAFYYHNAQHPGAPIKDVVQVYYQFKNEEKSGLGMPMPAGTVRVYQSDSKGGVAVRRRGSHRSHAERRGHQSQDRQRVRRRLRAQADGFPEDRERRVRRRVRDHGPQSQGRAGRGRGERADRRHVADAAVVARVDEDRSAWAAQFAVPVARTEPRCSSTASA